MTASVFTPGQLIYEVRDRVATITLNRPEKLNALTAQLMREIVEALGEVERDEEVRCVVFTGAGRGFCSGADLLEDHAGQNIFDYLGYPAAMLTRIPLAIRHMKKPSVAAINGVVAGGGLGVAYGCDIRIASDRARFTTVFLRRGFMPQAASTYTLPRLVRPDQALELLLLADTIDAADMERLGLATHVVPHDDLMERAHAYAVRIAKAPFAITTARKAVYQNLEHGLAHATDIEEYFARLVGQSEDAKEGLASFLEKREAQYLGR